MRYSVILLPEPEVGGYSAFVPAIPGCVTQGDTVDEALAMAAEAASLLLSVMVDQGEEIPDEAPGAIFGSVEVTPSASDLAAVDATEYVSRAG